MSTGKAAAYKIEHANILPMVDAVGPAWSGEQAAEAFSCHRNTVAHVRERLVDRLEIHDTPQKHDSWLNVSENELSGLTPQCLDHRIPDAPTRIHETASWHSARNKSGKSAVWQFTTDDARIRLKRLYAET
jgi:hypothetical protein